MSREAAVVRAYRALVRLLPRPVRARDGEEMVSTFAAMWAGAHRTSERARCLWRSFGRLPMVALAEWYDHLGVRSRSEANGMMMSEVMRDLGHAVRSLSRAPGFTAITAGTLALAIGTNAGIFTVVDTVLLDPLPFEDTERLVTIQGSAPGTELPEEFTLGDEFYHQYRESPLFESVDIYGFFTSSLRVGDQMERALMSAPSTSLFETLGAEPILGRLPQPEDSENSSPGLGGLGLRTDVVVLSHAFWTSRFGSDPDVLGRSIFAAGANRTVIGVMGPDFWFPTEGVTLWLPVTLELADVVADAISGGPGGLVARLSPGVTREALLQELSGLAAGLPERFGGSAAYAREIQQYRPVVRSLEEELLGNVAGPLWILVAAAGVVLLIACVNVANLFMVRAESRLREVAVRRALGAGRIRVISSVMSEAAVVAALSGILAALLARVATPLILSAAPPNVPRLGDVGLGAPTLLFAALASVFCALACGLVPALRSSAPDLNRLREGGRGPTRGRQRGRDGLVAAQTALALVLLISSGLLVRSFWALSHVDPGYDTDDIFTFQIAPQLDDPGDLSSYVRFHMNFMDRLRALPGVTSVGILENVPLDEGVSSSRFLREEQFGTNEPGVIVSYTLVGGDVFETMGIDLLEGRMLESDDLILSLDNVVINQSTANLLWSGESPLGRRIRSETTGATYSVVGVVEDVLQYGFRDSPIPMLYLAFAGPSPGYVVKTERAEQIAPEIRALVREAAPGAPMYRVYTMAGLAADSMVELSFTTLMLGIVSTLALILGAIGLYGVLSYVVAQRTREIGVRMALGAEARHVQRMVVAQGARVLLVGIVVGLGVALAATRALESLLFGVESADVGTFLSMSAALALVGLLASYLPARRASSVDPIESLRGD